MCVPLHNLESAPVTLSMSLQTRVLQRETVSANSKMVPSMPSCPTRLLPQCCDQHLAWNRVQRFDSCPPSWFRERFPLARLNIVTFVVSHIETVPPFQTLRCLQRFRESICCVRLGRFLDHSQLSHLVFRLKSQESCFVPKNSRRPWR